MIARMTIGMAAWAALIWGAGAWAAAEQKPAADAEGRPLAGLRTRWAEQVNPDAPLPEYPRPQMVREGGVSLNGRWDYAIMPRDHDMPQDWDGKIVVPFCVESQLSGVRQFVGSKNRIWYHRVFEAPRASGVARLLLHFGAVDWDATVFVNGREVGRHKGGYEPFTLDITGALMPGVEQELIVSVWDPTDDGEQPRGKQIGEPKGIWYTSVTGIWQPVWLEPVPAASIASVVPVADVDAGLVRVTVTERGPVEAGRARVVAFDGGQEVGRAEGAVGEAIAIKVPDAKLWSPDSPHLYDLEVALLQGDQVVDSVKSYFAMRKIERRRADDGFERLFLNGKPLFQFGPLDQGWWPDGLYTAPTDEALRYDIEVTKRIGCNMIRKHVKVEPARWYHHCDKLGILVWQDMPSAFASREGKVQHVRPEAKEDWARPSESARQFEEELREVIEDFRFFPCIVMWVPFNEGWGQYETARIAKQVKAWDPSRLVNSASGWTDRGAGDVNDVHQYPGPGMEPPEQSPGRAIVLGEFGGLGLPIPEHLWWNKRNWGYQNLEGKADLLARYTAMFNNLVPMRGRGLAAAVYTQTTDVEGEINGYMTYDRAVLKLDAADLARVHAPLYGPVAKVTPLMSSAETAPQQWRYTLEKPAEGWDKPDFDDSGWMTGAAPFRGGEHPFVGKGTAWDRPGIWMRRCFDVAGPTKGLGVNFYALQDIDVHLNGEPLLHLAEHRGKRHYDDVNVSDKAGLLRKGRNVIAVSGAKPKEPRAIDIGLYGF
ncbi:MAG TPA: glycoside hydrolase family 2 TIM barrel-domain containing protein [Verrucomicrobiae bacterium]|nr:glycoside hydrolase family 2 TIM barrel-domain containing protein [Verrucomicrobiae bacterium]